MGLAFSATLPFAGALAADEKLIDLNMAGKLFTVWADGTSAKLLQPCPRGVIVAETQELLKVHRIDAGFPGREPAHGFKPVGDRFFEQSMIFPAVKKC
jgi:hypothetical protein